MRAFEAAARRGGFVAAATELNVTPAAVSHQVKSLESSARHGAVSSPAEGTRAHPGRPRTAAATHRGFDHLSRAVGALSGGDLTGKLYVSAAPSFASLWLVPRLRSFLRAFPEIRVRVLSAQRPPDLNTGEVDIRIPYGMGEYPGFKTELLLRESIFPVCAPSLLNQNPLRRFSDLRHHTLLHDIDIGKGEPTMTWKRWLRDAGLADFEPAGNVEFGDSILLTEAAVEAGRGTRPDVARARTPR
ncbi:MAG: LysR substrate-binding domain-containing protein [Gammaproteobacteria bacterium]|nr:LysR substrate-binding domain-containing protein [Gammaproteobacteria bacterium]